METIVKSKEFNADDLKTFCMEVMYEIGLDKVRTIKINTDTYKKLQSMYSDFEHNCVLHNAKIDASDSYPIEYITVYYETKDFEW